MSNATVIASNDNYLILQNEKTQIIFFAYAMNHMISFVQYPEHKRKPTCACKRFITIFCINID